MIVERLLKVALLGSSWVLYLLLFLSVVSFSAMFERYLFFRRHRVDFEGLLLETGSCDAKFRLCPRELLKDQLVDETLMREGREGEVRLSLLDRLLVPVGPDSINSKSCVLKRELFEQQLIDQA